MQSCLESGLEDVYLGPIPVKGKGMRHNVAGKEVKLQGSPRKPCLHLLYLENPKESRWMSVRFSWVAMDLSSKWSLSRQKGVIKAITSCPVIQIEIKGFSGFNIREAPSSETFFLLCNS